MGYEHISIKEAKDVAASIADGSYVSPYNTKMYNKMLPDVQDFCVAVEQSIRGVKTIARSRSSAFVYREDEPYVLGWIGYEDYQSHITGEKKYAVHARDINNGKYADYNMQHFMRMSVNLTTAVKNTRASLRSYTDREVGGIHAKKVRHAVAAIKDDALSAYNKALDKVGLQTVSRYSGDRQVMSLLDEVLRMQQAGHTFTNLELDQDMQNIAAKKKEAGRFTKGVIMPMDFVHIYARNGTQYVSSSRATDITDYGATFFPENTWTLDEVPEDVQGKIAVMSMCEDDEFVEGVGYKANDTMFYFYVEEAIA